MYRLGSYEYIAIKDYNRMKHNYNIQEYQVVCLYAQQSIEKFLKAYISINFIDKDTADFLRGHKLLRLIGKVDSAEISVIKSELRRLSELYIDSRYPGEEYTDCTKDDAEDAIRCADTVHDWFLGMYPTEENKVNTTNEFN